MGIALIEFVHLREVSEVQRRERLPDLVAFRVVHICRTFRLQAVRINVTS